MTKQLTVTIGQHSAKGKKPLNQDACGAVIPAGYKLNNKGVALAIADGISSSNVSQVASATAVNSFLTDYYSTPVSWSVKTAARRVIQATNAWLYAQTHNSPYRFNKDKGYICTFSALVLKSRTAHLFHCGDTRIYRLSGGLLEQLTRDHRHSISEETCYLTRAMGIDNSIELDYSRYAVEPGDRFILASDGVYEFIDTYALAKALQTNSDDLDALAELWVNRAIEAGSDDNLTLQIVGVLQLPDPQLDELQQQCGTLAPAPVLTVRSQFEGLEIIRELAISSRSHILLALDSKTGQQLVIKSPSTAHRHDKAYLDSLLMEEWIARRIANPYVVKALELPRARQHLFTTFEYIEGQTLAQWMLDNPKPDLETVRHIVQQIARGLQALHRLEILHQDLRPQNIMIDQQSRIKIIDLGGAKVAGLVELGVQKNAIMGTAQYTAPEYFVGGPVSYRADLFSLGVICYQLLGGQLPYGTAIAKVRDKRNLNRIRYRSLLITAPETPAWVDDAIARATRIDPQKRYAEISEFIADLHTPNRHYLRQTTPPLIERNPVLCWQLISLMLLMLVIGQYFFS